MKKRASSLAALGALLLAAGLVLLKQDLTGAEFRFVLPVFDVRKTQWKPTGDRAWLFTGFTQWPAKITAMDVTPDGTGLVIGDGDGHVGLYSLTGFTIVWRKQLYAGDGGTAVTALKIDPTGGLIAVGAMGTGKAHPLHLVVLATGEATAYPIDPSPHPPCAAIGAKLDPIQFRWLPGGKGIFINYTGNVTANRGDCMALMERWLFYRNFEAGVTDARMVHLDSYSKPEGDEPKGPRTADQPYIDVTRNGKTVAVSAGNGRLLLYDLENHKIKTRAVSRSIRYWLRQKGLDLYEGNGHVHIDSRGYIYVAYSQSAAPADTYVFRFSPDLGSVAALAATSGPMPALRMTPNERYLMCGGGHLDIWDMAASRSLYHGPSGKCNGRLALFHPKKRVIMVPDRDRIYYLIERPLRKIKAGPEWTAAGVRVFARDSVYVRGRGKIGAGFVEHRPETGSWPDGELFLNRDLPSGSGDDDIMNEGELYLASPASVTLEFYGGRTAEEGAGLAGLFRAIPGW